MWIIPRVFPKNHHFFDCPTLAYFGAGSPGETHCFDCLIFGVLCWIHVWSTIKKLRKTWVAFEQHQNRLPLELSWDIPMTSTSGALSIFDMQTPYTCLPLKLMVQSPRSACQAYPSFVWCFLPWKIILDAHTKLMFFKFVKIHDLDCLHGLSQHKLNDPAKLLTGAVLYFKLKWKNSKSPGLIEERTWCGLKII